MVYCLKTTTGSEVTYSKFYGDIINLLLSCKTNILFLYDMAEYNYVWKSKRKKSFTAPFLVTTRNTAKKPPNRFASIAWGYSMKKEYYHRKNLGSYGVMYGFQFINLIKMKGKVPQGATWWFWARYPFIRYLIHFVSLTLLKQVTTENVSQKTTGSFNLARFSQVGN